MSAPLKVAVVLGTRPEAIKLAPVIGRLRSDDRFTPIVCSTGQHREMLDQVLVLFDITTDHDLRVMRPNQALPDLMGAVLTGMTRVIAATGPDLLMVQGDTTTAMAAAMAAYYQRVPVVHLEAGLRSGDMSAPWPEEMNRRTISLLASIHLAPTERSRQTLIDEGVVEDDICLTGNTVIDALIEVDSSLRRDTGRAATLQSRFPMLRADRKLLLVTCHRRESWGAGIESVCSAVRTIASRGDVDIIYPVHRHPNAQAAPHRILGGLPNVHLVEPLDYAEFVYLLGRSYFVITDSGGVQEEAPALGKPVLVIRETTERPEGVAAGVARLVGTSHDSIVEHARQLLDQKTIYEAMSHAVSPYGDGHASRRTADFMAAWCNSARMRAHRGPTAVAAVAAGAPRG